MGLNNQAWLCLKPGVMQCPQLLGPGPAVPICWSPAPGPGAGAEGCVGGWQGSALGSPASVSLPLLGSAPLLPAC